MTKEGIINNFAHVSGLNARVFHPSRVGKYEEIIGALEIWERELKEYEKITGESIADVTRFGALCRLVPQELGTELHKLPNIKYGEKGKYTAFREAKRYVINQVHLRREPCFGKLTGKDMKTFDYGGDGEDQCRPCGGSEDGIQTDF